MEEKKIAKRAVIDAARRKPGIILTVPIKISESS